MLDRLLSFGALAQLGFILQLIIAGFLLRSLAAYLEARSDQPSELGRALAFIY